LVSGGWSVGLASVGVGSLLPVLVVLFFWCAWRLGAQGVTPRLASRKHVYGPAHAVTVTAEEDPSAGVRSGKARVASMSVFKESDSEFAFSRDWHSVRDSLADWLAGCSPQNPLSAGAWAPVLHTRPAPPLPRTPCPPFAGEPRSYGE
jgi:hypothetical protein